MHSKEVHQGACEENQLIVQVLQKSSPKAGARLTDFRPCHEKNHIPQRSIFQSGGQSSAMPAVIHQLLPASRPCSTEILHASQIRGHAIIAEIQGDSVYFATSSLRREKAREEGSETVCIYEVTTDKDK